MVRYLNPPRRPPAGLGATVWDQMAQEFAAVPPLTVHVSAPEVLAAAWSVLRETVLVPGAVPRGVKEAIAVTVSATNACAFCVDFHSMYVHAARGASRAGTADEHRDFVEWAQACRSPGDRRLVAPPFSEAQAPEAIGTAAAFSYINRIVSVLLDDSPFPLGVRFLRRPLRRIGGRFLIRSLARPLAPDESLARPRELPAELSWASARPTIAAAFTALGTATAAAAERSVPEPVRQRLGTVLEDWRGEEPPFGRRWLDDATADLPADTVPAARLAVVVALAPARVDAADVAAFAAHAPGDRALVDLLSWTAFETTRRATRWLRGPY